MGRGAALYGALLGLGFTTFVLSFGVWALAGICFAVGEPELGLVVGVAFGLGRALPIVALAPAAGTPLGARAIELMAAGGLYRGFRLGDALALALAAVALGAAGGDATAAQTVVANGADPSASEADLVYQAQDRSGVLLRDGQEIPLDGTDPAVGGPYVAVIDAGWVVIRRRDTLEEVTRIAVPGVDALAVSGDWLVVRRREGGRDVLEALRITDPLAPGETRRITSARSPSQIGRPAIDGDMVVWATAQRDESRIWKRDLGANKNKIVVGSRFGLLTNPALEGRRLIYVRSGGSRDQVMATKLGRRGAGHPIYRESGAGILWSTALEGGRAYVTVLSDGGIEIITVN
jgi:hypothetical protein